MTKNQRSFSRMEHQTILVMGSLLALTALPGCEVLEMLGLGSWDGTKPFQCGGSQNRTFKDLKIKYSPAAGEPFADNAISAGGDCQLTLINCEISGNKVISAGGNAHIIIKGGKIEGKEEAMHVGGNATIEVTEGAQIVGPVESGGAGKIMGMPEQEKKQTVRSLSQRFGKGACDAVIRCYQQNKAFGNVQGLVSGEVNASGKVTAAKYSAGEAPQPVRQCLEQAMVTKSIAGFDGKPGKLQCQYAGTLTAGSQMLSLDSQFVR
jgi:hypothetical protein